MPSQGTCLGCRPGPWLHACERQPINVSLTHRCFSTCLSASLPLLLKVKKIKSKKKKKKKSWNIFQNRILKYTHMLLSIRQNFPKPGEKLDPGPLCQGCGDVTQLDKGTEQRPRLERETGLVLLGLGWCRHPAPELPELLHFQTPKDLGERHVRAKMDSGHRRPTHTGLSSQAQAWVKDSAVTCLCF